MSIPARLKAFGIARALDYLDRDPDANLPKLMEWLDRFAGDRLPFPYQELFHRAMTDPDNNWHRLIRSMYTDIDTRVLKKIFENFIIHGGLLEWPAKKQSGELSQDKAPWSVIIDPSFPCTMDCTGCGACRRECPQGAIDPGSPYVIRPENCLHCGSCLAHCPVQAVVRLG